MLKLLSDDTPFVVFAFFVFSPASFLFPVYEPSVFGRKEIFFFLAFALTIFIYRKFPSNMVKVCSFLALYTIATLIHEAALFFAPLAGCLLVFSISEHKKHFRLKVLCFLLFYVFALGIFLLFSIDRNYDPSAIIKSWSPYFPNLGTGIALVSTKVMKQCSFYWQKAVHFNQFTGPFLRDFCLAFLPIILLLMHTTHLEFFRTLRKNEPLLFAFTIASLLSPLLLFTFFWTGEGNLFHFDAHFYFSDCSEPLRSRRIQGNSRNNQLSVAYSKLIFPLLCSAVENAAPEVMRKNRKEAFREDCSNATELSPHS